MLNWHIIGIQWYKAILWGLLSRKWGFLWIVTLQLLDFAREMGSATSKDCELTCPKQPWTYNNIYIYTVYIYTVYIYIYRVYIYVTAIYHMNIYMNITHIHTYVCCARYCACTILVVWVLAGAQSKYNQQFGWWTLQPGCQGKICKQYLWRWNLEWLQLHMSDDFYLLDVRSQED